MGSEYRDGTGGKELKDTGGWKNTDGTSLSSSIGKTLSGSTTRGAGSTILGSGASGYAQRVNEIAATGMNAFNPQSYDGVTDAQSYLQNVISNKPGSYQSKYTGQLDKLYDQLMNRGSFNYDMNGDALYQNYRQRYMGLGRQSMRDTMGQAAATTGGYGSSYAQTSGQGAYNNYLQQLQDAVPTLQQQAQQRYNEETSRMTDRYNLVNTADTSAYNRYRDQVGDYQDERSYAAGREQTMYDRAYQQHRDAIAQGQTYAGWEREDAANAKSQAQTQVDAWIKAGIKPSRAQVRAAGLDYDQVMAYYKKTK